MVEQIKSYWHILSSPKSGLIFANRFTVVVCLITIIFDQAMLLFDIMQDEESFVFYDDIIKGARGNYIMILALLFVGAIVWAYN